MDFEDKRDAVNWEPPDNFVFTGFRETRDYFIFIGFNSRKFSIRIYNKETKDLSEVSTLYTNIRSFRKNKKVAGFENDIDSGFPFRPDGQINSNTLYSLIPPDDLSHYYHEDNFLPCKNPEQREELKRRAVDNDCWVLMLVHIK